MASTSSEHLEKSKNTDDEKEALHELRKSIDALIQWTAEMKNFGDPHAYRREVALVHTKLQEAKMWTGKCLEMLGNELPPEFRDKAE